MVNCPKCSHVCMVNEIAIICPNCDYISMKKIAWNGGEIDCPKCKSKARVYKHAAPGKSFICDNCNTIGRFFDEEKLNCKIVKKDSEMGKRLSWLFEVPCPDWKKRELIEKTKCRKCDLNKVCKSHLDEIERFCNKKKVEIYLHNDFIEVVHQ
ncbi:MAG: hypothetical protein V1859_05015 [archaeon]